MQQGWLYPAQHRLERRGWIKAPLGGNWTIGEPSISEFTRQGRKQFEAETAGWRKLAAAVGHVLDLG
ncbi:MAG TPA: hypothetical protein VGG72_20560 [Bryobacteraceae bacterium]